MGVVGCIVCDWAQYVPLVREIEQDANKPDHMDNGSMPCFCLAVVNNCQLSNRLQAAGKAGKLCHPNGSLIT